jgi:toxin HigB-1
VLKTFADRDTQELYLTGASRRFPKSIWSRAARKLEQLNAAATLSDLRVPPSNRLHVLHSDRTGEHAIAVNDQWRICFRFRDGDAFDVGLCDYH